MSREEVRAFFDAYQDAFNALDGDAVAELWHVPSGITDSRTTIWWPDDAPMRANHRALCDIYRGLNYGQADHQITAFHPLGADHAFADVRWTLRRQDGSEWRARHQWTTMPSCESENVMKTLIE